MPKLWLAALTIVHELSHKEIGVNDKRYDYKGIKPGAPSGAGRRDLETPIRTATFSRPIWLAPCRRAISSGSIGSAPCLHGVTRAPTAMGGFQTPRSPLRVLKNRRVRLPD